MLLNPETLKDKPKELILLTLKLALSKHNTSNKEATKEISDIMQVKIFRSLLLVLSMK